MIFELVFKITCFFTYICAYHPYIMAVTAVLFLVGCLFPTIHSHTTEICIAVSEDQTVMIGASTYHTDTVVIGGALMTINGVTTRYDFTDWRDDDGGRPPLSPIEHLIVFQYEHIHSLTL